MRSVEILKFPPEVLSYILSFLPGKELTNVALVCKSFYEAAKIDFVWQRRCKEEYGVDKASSDDRLSYFDIYSRILYDYGDLLGLWCAHMGPYGGLINVTFSNNKLVGRQYSTPPDPYVTKPLKLKTVFTVETSAVNTTAAYCHHGYHGQHECILQPGTDKLDFICNTPEMHRHPESRQQEFIDMLRASDRLEDGNMDAVNHLEFHRFLTLINYQNSFSCTKLAWPVTQQPDAIIQPGLFKGTYGPHGVEIVLLTYLTDTNEVQVTKITGDHNVPAGKMTIRADLDRPMVLTESQQQSVEVMADMDTADLPPDTPLNKLPQQPFVIPRDCWDRYNNAPTRCKARFHAVGQIANFGFNQPRESPSHWIVFNEDMFGNMWLELKSFGVYSRVKESFT